MTDEPTTPLPSPVTTNAASTRLWHSLSVSSLRGWLRDLMALLTPDTARWLERLWPFQARPDQLPPAGDWTVWLVMGGRGAGKTRTGAEWVRALVYGKLGAGGPPAGRIALVGETFADVRDVMVEGVSGLLAVHPRHERPTWSPSRRRLEWPNGASAQAFSSEDPEALRGAQFDAAWADELAKWRHADATFDMLQFGLRLGARPRQVVTTTPRAVPLLRRLLADPGTATTRARTADNAANLAPAFLTTVVGRYQGTRLGRQELDGELVEERADALWTRAEIEAVRISGAPPLTRVVVAVDPPAGAAQNSDACGIVAAGLDGEGRIVVVADRSCRGARPETWARRAVALFHALAADRLVAEVNQGGEMVAAVIREVDAAVPVAMVRATRGKWVRAEPVAALYAQGRVRHAGAFPELEDEMCDFGLDGLSGGRSPDRLDALVWAVTELTRGDGAPRVRRF
ncbi:terminase-like family protein [Pleomorphomonas sp. SM30]|uniref:Phage terminase large subunit-like protein n=2 Tax=Oharaeibacter diazotrophicus TaxID=1920512 RepID=A0A4R6RB15_9HYPH|nr:phage terminase large subunit-like protein [Oharaeibacter diazotrophicus]BBE72061.1 terminase-like family protein [Pleomorphomonas sp. SM30]